MPIVGLIITNIVTFPILWPFEGLYQIIWIALLNLFVILMAIYFYYFYSKESWLKDIKINAFLNTFIKDIDEIFKRKKLSINRRTIEAGDVIIVVFSLGRSYLNQSSVTIVYKENDNEPYRIILEGIKEENEALFRGLSEDIDTLIRSRK